MNFLSPLNMSGLLPQFSQRKTGLEGADDIVSPHTLARLGSAFIILVTGSIPGLPWAKSPMTDSPVCMANKADRSSLSIEVSRIGDGFGLTQKLIPFDCQQLKYVRICCGI